MPPKKLKPEDITIYVDTREKVSWEPEFLTLGYRVKIGKVEHGDYTCLIPDLRHILAIERKATPSELAGNFCKDRARFERELYGLRAYKYRAVICSFSFSSLMAGEYRSKANPEAVCSSVAKWCGLGVPFIFTGSRAASVFFVAKYLLHRCNMLHSYCNNLFHPPKADAPAVDWPAPHCLPEPINMGAKKR